MVWHTGGEHKSVIIKGSNYCSEIRLLHQLPQGKKACSNMRFMFDTYGDPDILVLNADEEA